MASVAGFLIYSLVRPRSAPVCLAVCNPFTNTRRELPVTHVNRAKPFVGAFAVNGGAHFKVVVAGGYDTPWNGYGFQASTEVYDSLTDSWSFVRMESGEFMPSSWASDTGVVCCDGIMYGLDCKGSRSSKYGEYALMAYEIESGVWRRDEVYDTQRGVWDGLKWRMEGLSGYLCLLKSTMGVLMLLGQLPHPGSPLWLWQLVSAAAGGRDVARWGDEQEIQFVFGQGLASARALYLVTGEGVMECKDFANCSSPAQWKMLSPFPRRSPPWMLGEVTVTFLLEPGAMPISSCRNL